MAGKVQEAGSPTTMVKWGMMWVDFFHYFQILGQGNLEGFLGLLGMDNKCLQLCKLRDDEVSSGLSQAGTDRAMARQRPDCALEAILVKERISESA